MNVSVLIQIFLHTTFMGKGSSGFRFYLSRRKGIHGRWRRFAWSPQRHFFEPLDPREFAWLCHITPNLLQPKRRPKALKNSDKSVFTPVVDLSRSSVWQP